MGAYPLIQGGCRDMRVIRIWPQKIGRETAVSRTLINQVAHPPENLKAPQLTPEEFLKHVQLLTAMERSQVSVELFASIWHGFLHGSFSRRCRALGKGTYCHLYSNFPVELTD